MEREAENIRTKISYYIVCFFILCLIGWGLEVAESFIRLGIFVNRGFLYGPFVPIYAFGALAIYFFLNKLMKKRISLWKINITPMILFMAMLLITAVLEYATSWILEMIFGRTWWNYSYEMFNLHGRIFLRNILLFGLLGIIYLYTVEPLMRKGLSKIKEMHLRYIAIICLIILSVDIYFSVTGHLHLW